jgi:enterochelin esterase-like enzyme
VPYLSTLYPSPESTYSSNGTHPVGIYLPKEYGTIPGEKYPVLYLSHGGGGADSDGFNQGRAQNILDRAIATGTLEPTVVVTPNFYDLGFSYADYQTNITIEGFDVPGLDARFNAIRENYFAYLIPWVESTFSVYIDRDPHAFTGLSLGGGLSLTMLFHATESFGYVGIMSNTTAPEPGDPQCNNPLLNHTGVWCGAGFHDAEFDNSRNF